MPTHPVERPTPASDPQPPQSAEPTQREKSRDFTTAIVAGLGTVVAAVVAFGAGIWGANIGANSDQTISVTEYRREQVEDVYASTYALVQTLEREEYESSPGFAIEDSDNPPPRDLARLERWKEAMRGLQEKYASLSVVASDEVVNTAADLLTVHRAIGLIRDIASTTPRELTSEIQKHNLVDFGRPLKSRDVKSTDDLDTLASDLSRQLVSETREDLDIK